MSNHEQLSSLLNDLVRKNVNIAAVALQEVWAVPYPDLVNIPGFNLIHNTRSCSRGGGVGFYIKDNFDYKIINDLSPFFEKEFESLTIEISTPGKKIILSNVYRSPSPHPIKRHPPKWTFSSIDLIRTYTIYSNSTTLPLCSLIPI
jgi:hypothetical protein